MEPESCEIFLDDGYRIPFQLGEGVESAVVTTERHFTNLLVEDVDCR